MEDRAKRFASLFRGSPRAHGAYNVQANGAVAGSKVEGQRYTAKEPANDTHFERHLAGTYGLGAVPLLLSPPGHTLWAAIDVDDYSIDVAAFARMCYARGIPCIPCRTKSGGVHLYCFFTNPIPVPLVRKTLKRWAAAIGYPDVEIFPKQDTLSADTDAGDSYWGNWINLPYQNHKYSTRYALSEAGVALSLDEFLDKAEASKLTEQDLENFELPPDTMSDSYNELSEAPPCIVRMTQGGVVSGARNKALFAVALMYKKMDADSMDKLTEEYNSRYILPPLGFEEVRVITRSAKKKDYGYPCKEQPIAGLCDREACEERKFGVLFGRNKNNSKMPLDFGAFVIVDTQPPSYRWEVNGVWVDLNTDDYMTQKLFIKKVFEYTKVIVDPIRPKEWTKLIKETATTARIEEPPPDATMEGQLFFHLGQFCTGKTQAKTLEELLLHKPYTDPVTKRSCFVVADFLSYLQQQRVSGMSERVVWLRLVGKGATHHCEKLKGKTTDYWSVPPIEEQLQEFDLPKGADDDIPF